MSTAVSSVDNVKFSEYPVEMDKYFSISPKEIKVIPSDFLPTLEKRNPLKFSSAKAYSDFIEKEIIFWDENDPKGKLKDFSRIDSLKKAKVDFDTAKSYFLSSSNSSTAKNYLNNSVAAISGRILYSKTALAKYIIRFKDENIEFLRGFRNGLLKTKTSNISNTVADYEGLTLALNYRKVISDYASPTQDEIDRYTISLNEANKNLSQLNASYTEAFHQQEERINKINEQAKAHIQEMNENSEAYFQEKERRCAELEALYVEKLKLQAPADYWAAMESEYNKKGKWWMGISIVWTVAIVAVLILTLAFLPNLFSENSHWIDVFKNSAIITVITSIAVYTLRIFVKLAMSSYHLARDAKERNKLTYFYLALIEKKAVSDKERAIVLNSLFSRADTGLLKGDSAPSMSANVSDLVQTLSK